MKSESLTEERDQDRAMPSHGTWEKQVTLERERTTVDGKPMTPDAGVTAREYRVSRDTTASEEGKALKAEILWAEVA